MNLKRRDGKITINVKEQKEKQKKMLIYNNNKRHMLMNALTRNEKGRNRQINFLGTPYRKCFHIQWRKEMKITF